MLPNSVLPSTTLAMASRTHTFCASVISTSMIGHRFRPRPQGKPISAAASGTCHGCHETRLLRFHDLFRKGTNTSICATIFCRRLNGDDRWGDPKRWPSNIDGDGVPIYKQLYLIIIGIRWHCGKLSSLQVCFAKMSNDRTMNLLLVEELAEIGSHFRIFCTWILLEKGRWVNEVSDNVGLFVCAFGFWGSTRLRRPPWWWWLMVATNPLNG